MPKGDKNKIHWICTICNGKNHKTRKVCLECGTFKKNSESINLGGRY